MTSDDFSTVATPALLDRALTLAREDTEDGDEYWAALFALRQRPERSVFDRAAEWSSHADSRLRVLGANVLAQLGAPACPFPTESTPLLSSLLHDTDDDVVAAALYALGHLCVGPTPAIATFAGHASTRVREAATFALGGRDEPAALDALRLLTTDADDDIRNWATFGLGSLCEGDSPEIRDALAARLGDVDDEIHGEAIVGLARRGDARAIPAIADELMRDDVNVLAIEAAEVMPSRQFVAGLRTLFAARPDDATLRALQRCDASDVGTPLPRI